MKLQILFSIPLLFFCLSPAFSAIENLDEMALRRERRWTNTYFSGATSTNKWTRQPESFSYTDSRTGHEVWILSNTPNRSNIYYTDISPANPWSADGSRLGFFSNRNIQAFTRIFGSSLDGGKATAFIVRSDGSHLRVAEDAANRGWGSLGVRYFWWSPIEPNVFFTPGEAYNGRKLDRNGIYKNIVSDSSIVYSKLIDLIKDDVSTPISLVKKVISPDGTRLIAQSGSYPDITFWPMSIYPENSASLLNPGGWKEQRGQTTEWAGGRPFACKHDVYFPSPNFLVLLFSQDCNSIRPVFYKYDILGTDNDGGPTFDKKETEYSTFDSFEVEPLWTASAPHVPWKLEATTNKHWWGHPGFGRWGRIVIFNDGNGYWEDNGVKEAGGPVAWDYVNRKLVAEPGKTLPKVLIEKKAGTYVDWNAWSDYFAYALNGSSARYQDSDRWLLTGSYAATHDNGNTWHEVAYHYNNKNGSTAYHWTSNARIAQSPDGTKIAYAITFFTAPPNTGDIAYAVAYFPHPPEISAVSRNTTSTYTIRFDWLNHQLGTSRGYTQRGWPDETKNSPPPPRETNLFRLWRSQDGTQWSPVTTVAANIFSRYNFSSGNWTGPSYWEFKDTPGPGTFYYAITAVEHSGLESRNLSNVFTTDGKEAFPYPNNPKEATFFYTNLPEMPQTTTTRLSTQGQYHIEWTSSSSPLIRYYNIYYSADGPPTPTRQKRIASIAAGITSYTDWLADPESVGFYIVTAVDSQGNESRPENELPPATR